KALLLTPGAGWPFAGLITAFTERRMTMSARAGTLTPRVIQRAARIGRCAFIRRGSQLAVVVFGFASRLRFSQKHVATRGAQGDGLADGHRLIIVADADEDDVTGVGPVDSVRDGRERAAYIEEAGTGPIRDSTTVGPVHKKGQTTDNVTGREYVC